MRKKKKIIFFSGAQKNLQHPDQVVENAGQFLMYIGMYILVETLLSSRHPTGFVEGEIDMMLWAPTEERTVFRKYRLNLFLKCFMLQVFRNN